MNRFLLVVFLLSVLVGCGGGSTPTPPPDTGIVGEVMLGPMCPVVREGEECPDQPYAAVIEVIDANGEVVAITESDASGHFQVDVPPGTYTLNPLPPEDNILPMAAQQEVVVTEGQYTQVIILYDTGIR